MKPTVFKFLVLYLMITVCKCEAETTTEEPEIVLPTYKSMCQDLKNSSCKVTANKMTHLL